MRPQRTGSLCILLLALAMTVGPALPAQAVLVSPQVHIQGGFSGTGTAFTQTSGTGSLENMASNPTSTTANGASATVSARANYGTLGVAVSTSQGTPSSYLEGVALAEFWDIWTIQPSSPALANTPFTLWLTMNLTGSWSGNGTVADPDHTIVRLYNQGSAPSDVWQTSDVDGNVAQTITFSQPCTFGQGCQIHMQLGTNAFTANNWIGFANGAGSADFLNTAELTGIGVVANNNSINNYTLTTESGHDYTTPVPEPATILLLGSGLAGIGAWSRKRLRRREP